MKYVGQDYNQYENKVLQIINGLLAAMNALDSSV
jgi:hypothetical protein